MKETTIESHHLSSTFSGTFEQTHAPVLVSPPETMTPPLQVTGKRSHLNGDAALGRDRQGSEAIDADALSRALVNYEEVGRARERTPQASPSRKRQRIYGDRSVIIQVYEIRRCWMGLKFG